MLNEARFSFWRVQTQSDRIKEAIESSGLKASAIAKACHVSPSAVHQWTSGETKELMGATLAKLAAATGFEALWIAEGIGPRQRVYAHTEEQARVLTAMATMSPYQVEMLVKITDTVASTPASDEPEHEAPKPGADQHGHRRLRRM